jgi:hypothetical protein
MDEIKIGRRYKDLSERQDPLNVWMSHAAKGKDQVKLMISLHEENVTRHLAKFFWRQGCCGSIIIIFGSGFTFNFSSRSRLFFKHAFEKN